MKNRLTMLIILDGFGIPKDEEKSGITSKNTKNLQDLAKRFPSTIIKASEEAVGLPKGQAGTSEVGHATIGSGRIRYQPLVRINREIKSGRFFKNKVFLDAINYCKKEGKKLHLIGLTSDGGIHSHIRHLFALLDLCKKENFSSVFIHFVGDGRDTNPKCVKKYLAKVEAHIRLCKVGKIVSIVGRYYALDRDKNWDRNKRAYNLWTEGKGAYFDNWNDAIDSAYSKGESDEFLTPILLSRDGLIEKGDCVISYNFRTDRERQLAYVMAEDNDLDFVKDLHLYFVTMTEYDEHFTHVKVAYRPIEMSHILSQVLSEHKLKQAKIAETEKYAHLTFFFNSGKQDAFENEDRMLINSKKMASYAPCPQMGAYKITKKAIEIMDDYDFIAINFANCDMVAHSGDKEATRKAVEIVDECVKKVVDEALKRNGQGIITADHGNADIMEYDDGEPNTSHTLAKVPAIIFGIPKETQLKKRGTLADIAPTLLKMMGIKIPRSMTGKPLFK